MHQLEVLMVQLENKIPKQETLNPQISQGTVGWHIEHALLVMDSIIKNLQESKPEEYQWKFNFLRTVFLTLRKFPRGKVQSPKSVRPKNDFNVETLGIHVAATKESMKVLDTLSRNHFFIHPFFGKLNVKPAVQFLAIHTKHHIHIINDIAGK